MTIENLRDGLTILIREGAEGYCIAAEHDVFYAGQKRELSESAKDELAALGWAWDASADSWRAFT